MSEFKLEVGKKYIDRRGRVYGPLVNNAPFFGEREEERVWMRTGKINGSRDYDMDLVAEYVETIESPDDWVTQDRVPCRPGIDQFRSGDGGAWINPLSYNHVHGVGGAQLRCRRKDLPPVEEVYPQYWTTINPNKFAYVEMVDKYTMRSVLLDGTEYSKGPPGPGEFEGRTRLTKDEALAKIQKPKPVTKTIKVHTVLYGSSVMLAKCVIQVLDERLGDFKRGWKHVQILKTEEFEVPCE